MKTFLSFMAITAIVGSALALTSKRAGYLCGSHTGPNQNCFVKGNIQIVPGTPNFWYDPTWDGNPSNCRPNYCPTPVRIEDN